MASAAVPEIAYAQLWLLPENVESSQFPYAAEVFEKPQKEVAAVVVGWRSLQLVEYFHVASGLKTGTPLYYCNAGRVDPLDLLGLRSTQR